MPYIVPWIVFITNFYHRKPEVTNHMERLAAFERMLAEIQKQAEYEREQMELLKAAGKEKSSGGSG